MRKLTMLMILATGCGVEPPDAPVARACNDGCCPGLSTDTIFWSCDAWGYYVQTVNPSMWCMNPDTLNYPLLTFGGGTSRWLYSHSTGAANEAMWPVATRASTSVTRLAIPPTGASCVQVAFPVPDQGPQLDLPPWTVDGGLNIPRVKCSFAVVTSGGDDGGGHC